MNRVPTRAAADGAPGSAANAGPASEARLACWGVTVRFGGLCALDDVGLAVPPATIVGLVGPNGAGKSTLFGVLSGLIRPSQGKVLLDGEDITYARPQLRAASGLARTFQRPELFAGLTVREHLVLAHRVKYARRRICSDLVTAGSLRPIEADEKTIEADEKNSVDELVELLGLGSVGLRQVLELPLGILRLLEVGRALAISPTVLLLDEPSSGLDSAETERLARTLQGVSRERRVSVLLVEHNVDLVMRMCRTVSVLDFGKLIAVGSPEEVRANPVVRAAYLGEALPDGQSGKTDRGQLNLSGRPIVESPIEGSTKHAKADRRSPVLQVEDLCVRYGEATALSGVSFELGAGQALAVLGANGAGKSSMARAVSGLVPPSGGRVLLGGEVIAAWPAHRIRLAGLVYLPEGRGVFPDLTVLENLRMAGAALKGRQARRDAVERAMQVFPLLAARLHNPAFLLSGGEQQMLSLARALATSPRLLIADDLSLGLDPMMVDLVFNAITAARDTGVAVIIIEQYGPSRLGLR